MRITRRGRAMFFFITLGVCLVGVAVTLNVTWIILNWRRLAPMIIGIPFFGLLIVGLILNTVFLVREVRRNEQQDSFLNAVTHELKTPITSIRLYLDTMRRRDVSREQQQEFLAVMSEDTDRLMATVEQVLKAGELGQRARSQVRVRVDMDQLVEEAVTTARLRYHLDSDAIHLERRELNAGSSFAVAGNPEELRTAVLNVIDNAVKYSPDGAHLTIVLSVESDAWVMVSVADQGLGIPQPQLKRIFRRFYRVPNRSILRVKGTGLGLFLVRSIARQHGGDAFAESAGEGRGSTFHLQLPRILSPGGTVEGGATV
ncbi:MAG TPA: HAMP domain-containing sensor histidine kinase [Acidobacteriaceae bacterium]|jgi:signal transduction histidine kinase|nr:HAMP domain-containing sensor histidine kinase [Acidobacteriaceae bacterium]